METKIYHGTNHKFEKFDFSKIGTSSKKYIGAEGFWFSSSQKEAATYGCNAVEKQIDLEKFNCKKVSFENVIEILNLPQIENDMIFSPFIFKGIDVPSFKNTYDIYTFVAKELDCEISEVEDEIDDIIWNYRKFEYDIIIIENIHNSCNIPTEPNYFFGQSYEEFVIEREYALAIYGDNEIVTNYVICNNIF